MAVRKLAKRGKGAQRKTGGANRVQSTGPAARGRRLTPAAELGERGYVAGGRPPAPDLAGAAPVRVTAYLRPDQVRALRARAAERQASGERADMSSLLREAVDMLFRTQKRTRAAPR